MTAWHFETVVGPYAATEWSPEADALDALNALNDAIVEAFGDEPPEGLRSQCRRGGSRPRS